MRTVHPMQRRRRLSGLPGHVHLFHLHGPTFRKPYRLSHPSSMPDNLWNVRADHDGHYGNDHNNNHSRAYRVTPSGAKQCNGGLPLWHQTGAHVVRDLLPQQPLQAGTRLPSADQKMYRTGCPGSNSLRRVRIYVCPCHCSNIGSYWYCTICCFWNRSVRCKNPTHTRTVTLTCTAPCCRSV